MKTKRFLQWTYSSIVMLCLSFVCTSPSLAQAPLHGTVTDSTGQPVVKATVTVNETKQATTTDESGRFSINAAKGNTISVTSVNYQPNTFTVTDQTSVAVVLSSKIETLSDVVVIGYGVAKRKM